jgi:uncharacterized protein (TIGR03066 family)
MKHQHKGNRHATPGAKPAAALPVKPPGGNAKRWVLLGLAMLLAFGSTWAFLEKFVWATTPSELVGKWVVTEGADEGGTVDFYSNGDMIATVNKQEMAFIIKAKIRVEDKKLYVTTKHETTGKLGLRVQTIKVLSGNYLVLEDERGKSVKMKRAND